jgi:flagellar biosynthesis/type III secretory pathway protein FliH
MGSGNGQHDYHACRDQECERYACRVWKEAWREAYREGLEDGYRQGYDAGYREGYRIGFAEGLKSCPGPHSG